MRGSVLQLDSSLLHLNEKEVPGGVAEDGADDLQEAGAWLGPLQLDYHVVDLLHVRHHRYNLPGVSVKPSPGPWSPHLVQSLQRQPGVSPHLVREAPGLLPVQVLGLHQVGRHVGVQREQLLPRLRTNGFGL